MGFLIALALGIALGGYVGYWRGRLAEARRVLAMTPKPQPYTPREVLDLSEVKRRAR